MKTRPARQPGPRKETTPRRTDASATIAAGADPELTVGGAKYTARVSAREILCATPTFDVISAHDMLYEEKVNK